MTIEKTLNLIQDSLPALPDEAAGFGTLQTPEGRLPLVALDVQTRISDLHAQTLVRQTFRNALDATLEATYIFPLPDRAAVTRFQMRVADRVIDGELKERGQAREEYDQAIRTGHRAAIAEEERSGVFTMRVGNLKPHEEAVVELTLVGPLPVSHGEATFRFPLVVAPRYTPGIPLEGPSVGSGIECDTDQVPDASRISPPVLLPGFPNPVRLSLSVQLEPLAGQALSVDQLRSSLHSVVHSEGSACAIEVQPGERLDRDFILRFPVAQAALTTSLKASPAAERPGVFALTLLPPARQERAPAKPREVVFVLDRSGSMDGWKMVAARRALGRMIDSLLDHDRFAVIAFDSIVEQPRHAAGFVRGNNRERWQMLEWLGKIEARGGTELSGAVDRAMTLFAGAATADRILVLVTDGQVSGEDVVLRRLKSAANGDLPRIFTVGIDRAVNAGFLKRLADLGRGDCELVESEDRLDAAMDRIHRLIGTPVLTQVTLEPLDADVVAADQAPVRIPDLFVDRPVTVYGRHLSRHGALRFRMHGIDAGGKAVTSDVVAQPGRSDLLTSVWGRARVRDLEDEYAAGTQRDPKKLMQQIVLVSLEAHVLSRFTAYVAVDRSEIVNAAGELQAVTQPVEMPDGWAMAAAPAGARAVMRKARARSANSLVERLLGSVFGRGTPDVKESFFRRVPDSRAEDGPPDAEEVAYCDQAPPASSRKDDGAAESMMQEFTDMAIDLTSIDFSETTQNVVDPDAPIVKLVDLVLKEAVEGKATEIQIEPTEDSIQIKYLINGRWVDRDNPPRRLLGAIVARIRILAQLATDASEGQFETIIDNRRFVVRVKITKNKYGAMVQLMLQA